MSVTYSWPQLNSLEVIETGNGLYSQGCIDFIRKISEIRPRTSKQIRPLEVIFNSLSNTMLMLLRELEDLCTKRHLVVSLRVDAGCLDADLATYCNKRGIYIRFPFSSLMPGINVEALRTLNWPICELDLSDDPALCSNVFVSCGVEKMTFDVSPSITAEMELEEWNKICSNLVENSHQVNTWESYVVGTLKERAQRFMHQTHVWPTFGFEEKHLTIDTDGHVLVSAEDRRAIGSINDTIEDLSLAFINEGKQLFLKRKAGCHRCEAYPMCRGGTLSEDFIDMSCSKCSQRRMLASLIIQSQ